MLQRMLQRTDVEGDKVHVKYSRGGTIYTTTLVRTSADRIQSIRYPTPLYQRWAWSHCVLGLICSMGCRELLEMLALAVSHAHSIRDNRSVQHLEEIEDGVMEILQENRTLEQAMAKHMLSVCVLPIALQTDFPSDSHAFLSLGV